MLDCEEAIRTMAHYYDLCIGRRHGKEAISHWSDEEEAI